MITSPYRAIGSYFLFYAWIERTIFNRQTELCHLYSDKDNLSRQIKRNWKFLKFANNRLIGVTLQYFRPKYLQELRPRSQPFKQITHKYPVNYCILMGCNLVDGPFKSRFHHKRWYSASSYTSPTSTWPHICLVDWNMLQCTAPNPIQIEFYAHISCALFVVVFFLNYYRLVALTVIAFLP